MYWEASRSVSCCEGLPFHYIPIVKMMLFDFLNKAQALPPDLG